MRSRTAQEILAGGFGDPGIPAGQPLGAQPGGGGQIGSRPLGYRTGAPPRTRLRSVQIIPYTAVGRVIQGHAQEATQIVDPDTASRVAILTAPFVGFSVYVGDQTGVRPTDMALPPGLPYEVVLIGGQALYAVTDAPVYLNLRVQIACILIGDRERISGDG